MCFYRSDLQTESKLSRFITASCVSVRKAILPMSSLPQFRVSINGLQMHAVYNCNSAVSSMSVQFGTAHHFVSNSPCSPLVTFTIMTSTVSKDQIEDVIFGRDWYNYCSGAEPFATMDLTEPGMFLCFGALPQSCIRARASLGNTTAVAKQRLSTQDDISMLDSDVPPGPGAALFTHDFNMASCSSAVATRES